MTKERSDTTLAGPLLETVIQDREREALDRVYELINQLEEVRGVLDCLLADPTTAKEHERILFLESEVTRLRGEICAQQGILREAA